MEINKIVNKFEDLIVKSKEHRKIVDAQIELHHLEIVANLTKLRDERDRDFQKEHNELLAHAKEYQEQLEEKERKFERAFKTVCAGCYDKLRAEFYQK